MNHRLFARRLLLACITLFLLVLAWQAIAGGVRQLSRSSTVGQHTETVVQLAFGVFSLLVVVTSFWWRQWATVVRVAWAVTLVSTAGLSSLVWGPPMPLTALAFAVVALLLALVAIWALQRLATDEVDTGEESGRTLAESAETP